MNTSILRDSRARWTLLAVLLGACEQPAAVRTGIAPVPVRDVNSAAATLPAAGEDLDAARAALSRAVAGDASVLAPVRPALPGMPASLRASAAVAPLLPQPALLDRIVQAAGALDAAASPPAQP